MECEDGTKTVYQFLEAVPRNKRVLFLCFSLSGLTSNLVALISLHEDLHLIRSDVEVWLGFRLGSGRENPKLGQITRNGVEWTFYELRKLKECILGRDQDARYQMLIRVLFCIPKTKQEYVIRSRIFWNE